MTNYQRWCYYLKDIESPEVFIEWGFFNLISAALQRRVWLYSDSTTKLPSSHALFSNDFVILTGKPATGKGRVITQISEIVKSPKLEKPDMTGKLSPIIPYSPDKLTLESLTQHIAGHTKSCSRKHNDKVQNYGYSPCCFLIEELEVLFSQNTMDMVAAMVALYDSHGLHYKTKHQGEDNLKNVCVTMIAGTTPDSIRDLMQNKVIKKGFTSRSILVFADSPRFQRQFPGTTPEQELARDELAAHVKALTNVFGEIVFSPEAGAYHKKLYEGGAIIKERHNNDVRLDDYYGRKNAHWLKLMMCIHYSEQAESNEIQKETVDKAWDVLQRTEERMSEAFQTTGRNVLHDHSIQIIRYIEEKVKVAHKELRWVFNKDLTKIDLDECLDMLISTGKINNNGGLYTVVRQQL